MPRRKPPAYKGILRDPPAPRDPNDNKKSAAERWAMGTAERFGALFDHYGIDRADPERWFTLSFRLALDFIPAFGTGLRKKPGRRPEPGGIATDLILLVELANVVHRGKPSVANAIRHLTRRHPRFKGKNPDTLRERYYLLKSPTSPEGKRVRQFVEWAAAKGNL